MYCELHLKKKKKKETSPFIMQTGTYFSLSYSLFDAAYFIRLGVHSGPSDLDYTQCFAVLPCLPSW